MKTLFINKLAPSHKDYVLSQEPETLHDAINTAKAMWKRKHPAGQFPKLQNLTMSPITAAIKDTLNGLPEDIREECILAIKSKRNNTFRNNPQGNTQQNNYSDYQCSNNGQSSNQNKGQKKKNKNSNNSSNKSITCWLCNKKGHTQIECRTRI
jgi:hypothetical protein